MIQGLCAAYQATGQVLYLQSARRAANFLMQRMTMPDGGLYRAWKDGAAAAKNPFGFSHLLAALDFSQHPVSIVLAGGRGEAAALVEAVHRTSTQRVFWHLPRMFRSARDDTP